MRKTCKEIKCLLVNQCEQLQTEVVQVFVPARIKREGHAGACMRFINKHVMTYYVFWKGSFFLKKIRFEFL